MKIGETVLAWAITVLLGSLLCIFFTGKNVEIGLLPIFIIFSGLTSLPYLIIYSLLARKMTNFLFLQLLHLFLAGITLIVILVYSGEKEILLVVPTYFVIGIIVHAIIFYRKPLNERSNVDSDILDN